MADQDIPQANMGGGFWGGLFGVLGPKLSMNADDARRRKDLQAAMYQDAIKSGQLNPEQIDYALSQIGKIYNDPNSKAVLGKVAKGVQQHIQSGGPQSQALGQGPPGASAGPSPAGGASPGGTMMAQAALPPPTSLQQPTGANTPNGNMMAPVSLPPPVALQQPVSGGGQAPPSQTTGGGPLPPPQMPSIAPPSPAQVLQPPAGLTAGGVLAQANPNPFNRADYVDMREHQHELESSALKMRQAAEIARDEGTKDYEIWLKRGQEVLGPKASPRDLAEYAATKGQKLPPIPRPHNQKEVLFTLPGSEDLHPGWEDPQNPESGVLDSTTGVHYQAGEYAKKDRGLALAEERGKYWGPFGNYYRAAKGKGASDEDARATAAQMVFKDYGVRIGRQEQQMAIESKLSGGVGGADMPKLQTAPPKTGPVPTSKPATNGANGTAVGGAGATPIANRVLAAPTPDNPFGLSQRDIDSANYFIGVQTGAQKGTGHAAVQSIDGQKVLARVGVSPEDLTARQEQRTAARKTIDKLAPIAEAVSALDNSLARHSTLLMNLRPQLPSSDITKINEWLQSGAREFNVGGLSKAAIQYGIALQAVRNEYARIIEGSGASIAGTSVQSLKDAGDKMRGGFTTGNTQAMLQMIDAEAKNKYGGYGDKLRELQQRMSQPLVPELKGGRYEPVVPTIPPPVATSASGKTIVQQSSKTGAFRHSLDGGVTWLPGKP